ncbi:VWA domain-containing protein [Aestuariibacter halophilus]|uniref:VWA domain-containing protein n=1 Tax=Fluctibacter halophilus TaxID=226011 RepID=A0ABS8G3R0_9ALTE|nr:VWA domain-containing protein [Aestuariibacter halophilus]MCC2615163.1 VWA domain-containing protein [Aestuariibacter halophilus]
MPDWSAFHFIRPEWFFALLPLLIIVLLLRRVQRQQTGWQGVLAQHLYTSLIERHSFAQQRSTYGLLALGWLLSVLALAGPTWEKLPQPVYQLHTGKVVVIDMSLSMRATDVSPDRLTRAKYKAIDLINAISEGDTGLVAYAGDAFTISPLSADGQNLTTLLPSLSPEIMPVPGSDPYSGLQKAMTLLENAGYQQGEIFWITDGIEMSQLKELTQLVRNAPYRLSVLGVGTQDGAPISQANGELLKDATGAIVIPKLNADRLQTLANVGGGRYAPLQADDSDIDYLTTQQLLDRETEKNPDEEKPQGDTWREMGPYLLLLLLPLAAYGFRRGVLFGVVLLAGLPLSAPPASANVWDDLWKTGDQQGAEHFQQQQFNDAAADFDNPMWRGSAQYRAGDFEAAANSFAQANTLEGRYNLGNALAQLGQLDEAIAAYDEVLEQDPEHADAAANKALLEQMKQQQEQQEQQNQQGQQNDQQQQDQQQDQQQGEQQQDDSDGQSSQQSQQQQSESDPEQQQDPQQDSSETQQRQDQQEQQQQEQQQAEQQGEEDEAREQQAEAAQAQPQEMTDEQRENLQRMENLLRRVPDDPAYLLKRKMLLENQQRKRQRLPAPTQRNW